MEHFNSISSGNISNPRRIVVIYINCASYVIFLWIIRSIRFDSANNVIVYIFHSSGYLVRNLESSTKINDKDSDKQDCGLYTFWWRERKNSQFSQPINWYSCCFFVNQNIRCTRTFVRPIVFGYRHLYAIKDTCNEITVNTQSQRHLLSFTNEKRILIKTE